MPLGQSGWNFSPAGLARTAATSWPTAASWAGLPVPDLLDGQDFCQATGWVAS